LIVRRRRTAVWLGAIGATWLASLIAAPGADAAGPWWTPVAMQGTALRAVSAEGETLVVSTDSGATLKSSDGGATFAAVPGNPQVQAPASVRSGADTWAIEAGRVLHASGSGPLRADPSAPSLGSSAHLIAAPAAAPGVVVAVATDGTVWRRGQDGDWRRALLLLPAGFPSGVPSITSLVAFTQPLSLTVYLGTDGYSVLNSTDGGDDWIRAGPGLPDSVRGLAADATARAVYAATSDGLWVHHLQALPAPTAYRDAALLWRWIGIGLTALIAALAAVLVLRRALAPARQRA
jgi:hypothetical protein